MPKRKKIIKKSTKIINEMSAEDIKKDENENPIGALTQRPIIDEMQESYLDYAMSVIISRALPDVRDGMKPVHRRILYAMWSIGLKASAKFRKSATVVGEVLGKYHPHGDAAVYESMVRMAQYFSMRYMLVNGQGNFGSMDGDRAAAMRYTEAKLERISEELLQDIEKDTVDFIPNYDGSHQEPKVFPAKLPNLLLNGTMGIAVGMATSIPPHNLTEIINGIKALIDNPTISITELMEHITGPDFPTGGVIYNKKDIAQAYGTGKGSIVMRGKAEIIEEKSGQFRIIVTEIPFQVNKSTLIENIANLVTNKKIDGIKDLRDESDKDGVRIVVELKREAYPKKVLNRLYTLTALQTSFHVNMLALVDGLQPRVLNLKMVLEEYVKHRQIVIKRRTQYDLTKAEDRAHILIGLKKAVDSIDAVIKVIKKSKDKEEAKVNLMKKFKFTERQSLAILEMKLSQLANLERLKIEAELKDKIKLIKELKAILGSKKKILSIIKDDLEDIKEKYGDERKTKVQVGAVGQFSQEDLIPNEATVIMLTRDGYIKRVSPETFKSQKRGGRGVIGLSTKEQDTVEQLFSTTTHADLLFFTSKGRVFQLKGYDIPTASRTSKGQAIVNFLQLDQTEKVSAVMSLEELGECKFLMMVTKKGIIKKVDIKDFESVRRSGLIAVKLKGDDILEWVKPSTGKDDIIIITSNGQAIRFKEKNVRAMGRSASGVRAIKLKMDDEIAGMDIINDGKVDQNEQLLVVMEKGFGKRTALTNYRIQGRGGTGIKTAKITPKTGKISSGFIVNAKLEQEDLVVISNKGQVIRMPLKSVSVSGRATQGVRLMRFSEDNDQVSSVTFV
ncbi:MAG: DNA gyrase subunit A [Candidatus Kerfeldbacteria bacterium]